MKWIDRLEKLLTVAAVVLMLTLVALNINNTINRQQRIVINNNTKVYNYQTVVSQESELVVKIDGGKKYPRMELLINGVAVKKFGDEREVKVNVKDRDLLQVNGSMYQEKIKVSITKIPNNVGIPLNKRSTVTQGNIQVLSTIRIQ